MAIRHFKPGEFFYFVSFIFLVSVVGVTGIMQIRHLGRVVSVLGTRYADLQRAVLEMRINNNLYGRAVRDFALWNTSRILDAAPNASSASVRSQAADNFDRYLSLYLSSATAEKQQQWAQRLEDNVASLRILGEDIIRQSSGGASRSQIKTINRLLVRFENRLYKIDSFLSGTMESSVLEETNSQIGATERQNKQAVFLLAACSLLSIVTGGLIAFSVYRSKRASEEEKKQILSQMLAFEDEQRQGIALQIHNEMGQNLTALKIHLALGHIAQCRSLLEQLLEKMHNIVCFLRPPALEEVGLSLALEELIIRYHHLFGMEYVYRKPQKEIKLPPEYNIMVYRVAQEALNNIAKHARAGKVLLALKQSAGTVKIRIEDDGAGFNVRRFLKNTPGKRMGLILLKERVEIFGGTISIVSVPGKGTKVVARFPVPDREKPPATAARPKST